ncbi:hypothetical protein HDU85_005850 [Gaertneriomyces sp. JEL0708]|nr:hypothetical protein HDU85_005850 [Gaertneriomyces sp. JEL0708]
MTHGRELSIKYRSAYGRIYQIWDGTHPELVLTTSDDVALYYKDGRAHLKQESLNLSNFFFALLGECVGLMHGEQWKRTRKAIDKHFGHGAILLQVPGVIREVNQWAMNLRAHALVKPVQHTASFDAPLEAMKYLPFFLIAKLLYGNTISQADLDWLKEVNEDHEKIMADCFARNMPRYKFFRLLPVEENRRLDKFKHEWKEFNLQKVDCAKKTNEATPASEMYDKVVEGILTIDQYLETLDEILFTNIDVTSSALGWQILSLAEFPEAQQKVYDEVKALLSNIDGRNVESPEFEHYVSRTDTYVHGMMLETARLFPVTGYTLAEVLPNDSVFQGHRIPAGTSVVIDAFAVNTTSPCWGRDGLSYRPERFFNLKSGEYRYALWRYGLGARKCLGQNMADKIIKAMLAITALNYEVSKPENYKLNMAANTFLQMPLAELRFAPRET